MELFCCEAQVDFECRAYADPVLLNDGRVLDNLLRVEERHVPSNSYFDCVQPELKPHMRTTVTEWMLEVCEEQQCQPDVYWLAVSYMDRFLGVYRTGKAQLQLLGAVCLFLASKLKETNPVTADKLVLYTDRSITFDQLWQWELLVLNRLKWDLGTITPHDFVDLLLTRLQATPTAQAWPHVDISDRWDATRRHAHGFIALCALEYKFTMYPPSMIACACVASALRSQSAAERLLHATAVDDVVHDDDECGQAVADAVLAQLHAITHIENEILRGCWEQVDRFMRSLSPTPSAGAGAAPPTPTPVTSPVAAPPPPPPPPPPPAPSTPKGEPEKAGTPTDVRDIHF